MVEAEELSGEKFGAQFEAVMKNARNQHKWSAISVIVIGKCNLVGRGKAAR